MAEKTPLIAVVDDEASVRRALERLLRSAGLEVCSFASGIELLSVVNRLAPDCVVLDLQLPSLSGFEVMEFLPGQFPVIALTGDDSMEMPRAGRAVACLRKPVDDIALLAAIQAAIARP